MSGYRNVTKPAVIRKRVNLSTRQHVHTEDAVTSPVVRWLRVLIIYVDDGLLPSSMPD